MGSRWYAEDCVRWLRWELRGLLAGQRLRPELPLSTAGIERWQLEAAVQRLLGRCGGSLSLDADTTLTPELSLAAVIDLLHPVVPAVAQSA